jgi:cullin 1
MSILTQFNESDTHTFKELQTATSIAEGILKPQLVVLVKMKVLLQDDDTYELNLSEFGLGWS